MALFLSTYTNKIDKKGRISVPAPFRSALASQHYSGIVVYASFIHPAIEASGIDRIDRLHEGIDSLDPFSEERDAFATAILGACVQLPFDTEGRVILPEELIASSGIQDCAVFIGKGSTFEIWQPEKFQEHAAKAREIALKNRHSLQLSKMNGRGGNGGSGGND